ncbi:MAG: bile acid:sodium symporter family protein [Flavobacteriales bacterium]|jgi:BASS family bile acid:Na+ symporter|nr:bile acid:sodium symporter family protein [Flavobacteriales bacterium]MBT3963787.1 bile acid:sodium symporter family protein [Flavobacteriales bacterium]MBT4705470.1 bile acid:sodium symporter family protein [Flavobacteriales bacterium]MBT4930419.1 bile acid:sodium symporter family protein [Flavobacteriales bacterium]MBT5133404.1 bile acid:sodium symporter family protein [Flavobacteriales bacterium]
MLEIFQEIDSVRLNFSDEGKMMLNATIAFIMFGVALELKPKDFIKLFKSPKPALVGILSQFILMPLLTFLIALSLGDFITPTIGLGMVLVAACPGGNISNFMSSLAKGNVALSVSLTAFSSFGGMILTPLNFAFWGNLYIQTYSNQNAVGLVRELNIDVLDVLVTILIILGIPLVAGVLFNLKFPELTSKILKTIKRISILAFIAIVVIIFTKNLDLFLTYIKYIFLLVLVHNALALTMGYFTGKAFRLNKTDCKTISIETGIQNSGLALALLFNPSIFPEDMAVGGMAFIAGWWGIWHIISGLTMAGFWSGFSLSKEEETAPA